MSIRKSLPVFIVVLAIVFIAAFVFAGNLDFTSFRSPFSKELTYDDALERLGRKLEDVSWREVTVEQVQTVALEKAELEDTLPAISTFPIVVNGRGADVEAEIFVSTEKSGQGTDGWMTEAAQDFNRAGHRLKNGKS
ncbi:MAG: hypothetical protein R3245_10885, partial [Kiloniellales bacterium]|nr:hypothetical protein [Kiloniellales bacterium]